MRILQHHASDGTPADGDAWVEAEAVALRRAGHHVDQAIQHTPLTPLTTLTTRTTLTPRTTLASLARSRSNRSISAAVADACRESEPDVVHVHDTRLTRSSAVIEAASEAELPIVMTIHDYRLGCVGADLFRGNAICTACVGRSPLAGVLHGCNHSSRIRSGVAAAEIMSIRRRSMLDRVDRFAAPSAFMADRLIDIGIPGDRMSVTPRFCADPGERRRPPSDSGEVLFVGGLTPADGVRTLLRSWEQYADRAGETRSQLTVIGDGPLASEAREAAPRAVSFAGQLSSDEVRRRMLAARALVFPSESYVPFGTILIEAMAAGLPIVTTTAAESAAITGTPRQLIAPAGNALALADCLAQLDDETVDRAGAAARSRFLSTATEAAGAAGLEALYSSVTAVCPAPFR